LTPSPAKAGAWIAEDGGQEIWTSVAGERDEASVFEASIYWEMPVSDDASVVAAPWLELDSGAIEGWRAEGVLGFKRSLLQRGPLVTALQGGALWMSHPRADCEGWGGELRWLGGLSIGEGFVNLEAATRVLGEGCGERRLDLTLGYRPADDWLGLGQVLIEAPEERESALRLQLSLVRFVEDGRGLQVGLRGRIDGGPAEPALVIGLWDKPVN
jgi:hypothetical protein